MGTLGSAPAHPSRSSGGLLREAGRSDHAVQLYEDDEFLQDVVVDFLASGFAVGEPLVVIATPQHGAAFRQRLRARGLDVDGASAAGRFTLLSAREILSKLMVEGLPSWELFSSVVGSVLEKASLAGERSQVRAYGEMVDLLWRDGNPSAAIRLEELWNRIAHEHRFSLLCAYSMSNFRKQSDSPAFHQVCNAHSHVLPTEGYMRIEDSEARLREVSRLQQRARALEDEIVHRKRIETALLEALSVRDDFLAVVSHELRTPLTILQLYIQSLLGSVEDDANPRVAERLNKAADQTRRLGRVIDELLDVSNITSRRLALKLEDVDLSALVREAVGQLADVAQRQECHVRLLAEEAVVGRWDRARVAQVISTLMASAIKHGQGAPIEVLVRKVENRAEVVVKDHGPGISAEEQEQAFGGFERAVSSRTFDGLGLGLWILRQIVEAHGGNVAVQSAPDQGATVTIGLPCPA